LGALLRALLFGKAMKGLLTDVELLAATAIFEGRHGADCECYDCEDRMILGLDRDDD